MSLSFIILSLFLFWVGIWIRFGFGRNKKFGSESTSSPTVTNGRRETIFIILDMENDLIEEFNQKFPKELWLDRFPGFSRYPQDYDPDYFTLLKAVKALIDTAYECTAEQENLVTRCLQMTELLAIFRIDNVQENKTLPLKEIEIYTRTTQKMKAEKGEYSGASGLVRSYEKAIEETLEAIYTSEDGDYKLRARKDLVRYKRKHEEYQYQETIAFGKLYDTEKDLKGFRMTLLNSIVDPASINDTTLNSQLDDFDRYSISTYSSG